MFKVDKDFVTEDLDLSFDGTDPIGLNDFIALCNDASSIDDAEQVFSLREELSRLSIEHVNGKNKNPESAVTDTGSQTVFNCNY